VGKPLIEATKEDLAAFTVTGSRDDPLLLQRNDGHLHSAP
jgi:hypothetical protein